VILAKDTELTAFVISNNLLSDGMALPGQQHTMNAYLALSSDDDGLVVGFSSLSSVSLSVV
jgi:hypothetical protein